MNKLLRKLQQWLGITPSLSAAERAEITAMAAVRALEVNAHMLVKSNGLMTMTMLAAQYRHNAAEIRQQAGDQEEGTMPYLSLVMLANELDDIANSLLPEEQSDNNETEGVAANG